MPAGRRWAVWPPRPPDVLSGKLNPQYVPYIDMGDHVVVINAEKVRLTGLKAESKLYRRYTGFPGGLREESFVRLLNRKPEMILEQAIKGMLPKSKMGRQMATKLRSIAATSIPTRRSSRWPWKWRKSSYASR